MWSVFVDGLEYSIVYRRYDKSLCEMLISSLRSIPALHKAQIEVRPISKHKKNK